MLDVTVKTLDGQNRSFSVPDDITVRQFKDKIANSINISADSQRLIFQGRVLQDDKNLNHYDVNGKTLHVVQRPPPAVRQSNATAADDHAESPDRPGEMRTFVGSFTLPSDIADPNEVQNVIQNVLAGMGDVGRNAHISTSSSSDGSSVDVRINLGQINPGAQTQNEAQNRLRVAQRMITRAQRVLDQFESNRGNEDDAMEVSPNESGTPPRETAQAESRRTPETTEGARSGDNNRPNDESETPRDGVQPSDRQDNNNTNEGSANQDTRTPASRSLAELLQDVFTINTRLQPLIERYQQFMEQEPTFENDTEGARNARRLCDTVSRVMHCISHVYHNLSDLTVDVEEAAPRVLRANPVAQQVAIVQQTIPIQAQISVAGISPRGSPQLPRRVTTSTTTGTTSASVTSSSSSSSSSTTTSRGSTPANIRMQGTPLRFTRPMSMVAPIGMGRGRHPFMVMDIRPQNIHINNITAQVVRSSTSTGTSTSSASNSSSSNETTSANQATTQTATSTTQAGAGTQIPFQFPPGMFGSGEIPLDAEHLPRPILQNVLQVAARSVMGGLGGQPQVIVISQDGTTTVSSSTGSTAVASSTTTSNTVSQAAAPSDPQTTQTQTSSSQTSTTQTRTQPDGQPPHGPSFVMPGSRPGFLPTFGLPNPQQSLDPYLPCHSRFFSQRQQSPSGGAGAQQSANSDAQPNNALADVLSGIISSVVNQMNTGAGVPHVEVRTAPSAPAPDTSHAQTSASVTTSTGQTTPATGGSTRPEMAALEELNNLLQSARAASGSSSGTAATESGQSADQQRPMGEEIFARLVSGIGSRVSQAAMGQQSSETIYDFATSLGQDYSEANEGLLTEIFHCVSRHLTIVDLMSIFCHQVSSLQRLVCPLQEFVRDRVLGGQEATEENIDSAVEHLIEEILPQIEEICTNAPVRDNIDFPASVQELLRFHFGRNVRLILRASEGDSKFAEDLFNNVRSLLHEFLMLSRCCLEGGQQAVENLAQANVRRIFSDMNPLIQEWMASMSVQKVQAIMRSIEVSEEQVQSYVVRRTDMDTGRQSQSSDASFVSAESGERDQDVTSDQATAAAVTEVASCNNDANEVMDTEGSTIPSPPRNSLTPQIPAELLQHLPPPPQVTDSVPVIVGSESWHSQVPPEWVEVITQDAHRQHQLPIQPPFSDAYINGMPPKRRKLMTHGPDEARELADIRTLLPQAVGRAAEAAGAEPITSHEDMEKDAAGSATLREAFQQEMNDSIRKRLREDSDYIAEKYPNTEKYYHKKK